MTVKRVCPFPVGGIYLAIDSTNPAAIWPNTTWQTIQDAVLMAAGSTYNLGSTGGSATHAHTTGNCTLTVDQIPSHTHEQESHNHTQNAHNHTQDAHAHTVNGGAGTNNITGGGHAHTVVASNDNNHGTHVYKSIHEANSNYGLAGPSASSRGFDKRAVVVGTVAKDQLSAASTTHTHSLPAHTHAYAVATPAINNTTATNQNTTATNNAATAVNKSTGGGKAHSHGDTGSASNLPPYIAVSVWKRVA